MDEPLELFHYIHFSQITLLDIQVYLFINLLDLPLLEIANDCLIHTKVMNNLGIT